MSDKLRRWINGFGWCALLLTTGCAAAFFVGLEQYSIYRLRAETYDLSAVGRLPERSAIFDREGNLYSYVNGENRITIGLKEVPAGFIKALCVREDAKFWTHGGLDYEGIARAALTNLKAGKIKQGGSSITQQLARNTFNLSGRSLDRKALEGVLAHRIEERYSKEQILEFYVNRIYFGAGYYGIEAASRGYFGKPANQLTLGESATLAALICSPNRLAPTKNPSGAETERNELLDRMAEVGAITEEAAKAARATPLVVRKTELAVHDDFIVDSVTRELAHLLTADVIEFGGLKIHTTLDVELQQNAQLAANRQLAQIEQQKRYPHPKKSEFRPEIDSRGVEKPTDYLQAAVVLVDNSTGGIRALVGGRDYEHSHYPRATLAKRQIGSTFKPFVYATAFERGLLPTSLVDDSLIAPDVFGAQSKNWSPKNSDGEYLGHQRADFGLLKSRNTMTVRVGQMVGIPLLKRVSNALNIGDSINSYPTTYIGGFETTLRDLTAAYTVFPNNGTFRRSHLIDRIEDHDGHVLYVDKTAARRIFSPEVAWMTSSILQQIMKTGTAAKASSLGWKRPAGGKTGTTDEFRDAWFVGYTSSLTCGVWVGMDKPETIMEKGYGSALALPIWVDVMNSIPELKYTAARFDSPVPLQRVRICSASGLLATSQCGNYCTVTNETFPTGRLRQTCSLHPEVLPPPIAEFSPQTIPVRPAQQVEQEARYRVRTVNPDDGEERSSSVSRVPLSSIEQTSRPAARPRDLVERTSRGVRIWNIPPAPFSAE